MDEHISGGIVEVRITMQLSQDDVLTYSEVEDAVEVFGDTFGTKVDTCTFSVSGSGLD